MKLFVYATLKDKHTLVKALHESKVPEYECCTLPGFKEVKDGEWPTLERNSKGRVEGDIIDVTPTEMKRLDAWETHYTRSLAYTDGGQAYTYVYKDGPDGDGDKLRAS